MSFTDDELEQHCQYILGERRIKNKIVILCEGGRYDGKERLSPQSYRRMEELPDANFYKDIWNYSRQSVWQLIQTFGNSLNQLKLPSDTPITGDFDDGISATSLVRGAHIIPGLEKVLRGYHLPAY
jgi:hypothetical protein